MLCSVGKLGEGVASQFVAFEDIADSLPPADEVLKNAKTYKLPYVDKQPEVVYALCGALAHRCTVQNIDKIITIGERFSSSDGKQAVSFSVMMLRDCHNRCPKIMETQAMRDYAQKYQELLI